VSSARDLKTEPDPTDRTDRRKNIASNHLNNPTGQPIRQFSTEGFTADQPNTGNLRRSTLSKLERRRLPLFAKPATYIFPFKPQPTTYNFKFTKNNQPLSRCLSDKYCARSLHLARRVASSTHALGKKNGRP
jgi:hypothetical protein